MSWGWGEVTGAGEGPCNPDLMVYLYKRCVSSEPGSEYLGGEFGCLGDRNLEEFMLCSSRSECCFR